MIPNTYVQVLRTSYNTKSKNVPLINLYLFCEGYIFIEFQLTSRL